MPKGQYERKPPKTIEVRFWEKAIVRDGCWGWQGYTNGIGYGILTIKRRREGINRNVYAHRISWEIHKGAIPNGLFVCHTCDNPECTNPEHLWLGTNADNMHDCSLKGRQNGAAKALPGERNPFAKLTEQIVREIRGSDESGVALGAKFGVCKSLISAIRKRRAWRHVA